MSFSFRNIFSPDESEFGVTDADNQPAGISAVDPAIGRGNVEAAPPSASLTQMFLASELLPYIPKAIAAQSGIPMEKELRVPLPSDGTLDVPLSAIYRLCPELFAVEITPLNDSVVTLPPRLGATPTTVGKASVFAKKSILGKEEKGTSLDFGKGNPFVAAEERNPQDSSKVDGAEEKEKSLAVESFSSSIPPIKKAQFPEGKEDEGKPSGGFAELSGGAKEDQPFPSGFSGFSPFPQPPAEEAEARPFATLFTKEAAADAHLPFPSPGSDPGKGEEEKEPQGVWGAMFSGKAQDQDPPESAETFAHAPFDSIGNLLSQAAHTTGEGKETEAAPQEAEEKFGGFAATTPSPASGFQASPAPVEEVANSEPAGFSTTGFTSGWDLSAPPLKSVEASEAASLSPLPPGFSQFVAEAPDPEAHQPSHPADVSEPAPRPESVPSEEEKSAPVLAAAPAPLTAPPAPASSPFTAPTEWSGESSTYVSSSPLSTSSTDAEDDRDLELRAIFSTSESFTLSKVARRVAGLPGILSCSLSLPGKLVQASRTEEKRVGDEAREMVATLRSLAKLTGLPEARTFTLQTDRGVVSLFLEGESCVTVHHDTPTFQPGVREKLILVARCIGKLRE